MSKPQAKAPKDGMTGVAFTIQGSKDVGFPNFRICTLFIVKGEIVHMERSQEYATFEAIARTEVFINSSVWNLSNRYEPGRFCSLGGDQRDEIVNRLKRTDPALLKRLAPALGMGEPA